MNARFIGALLVVLFTVSYLVYSAVRTTAKRVVTVSELQNGVPRTNVRLGARVADKPIETLAEPDRGIRFFVRDITGVAGDGAKVIPVEYHQTMPETLKIGRDVILEGQFDGARFEAKTLVTQCPSKYVPPTPGGTDSEVPRSGAGSENHAAGSSGEPASPK